MLADLLLEFSVLPASESQSQFLFAHPGLLSPGFLDLQESLLDASDDARHKAIGAIRTLLDRIERGETSFVMEAAPIAQLRRQAASGELTAATALRLAARPEIAEEISTIYLRLISDQLFDARESIDAVPLLLWMRLIRAAAEAAPPFQLSGTVRAIVDGNLVKIATQYLREWADGRALAEARAIGERALAALQGDVPRMGETLHCLGVLYLDPYAVHRRPGVYGSDIQAWKSRFIATFQQELNGVPQEQWAMPSAPEALATAEGFLRQALPLRTGNARAKTLKALAQALLFKAIAKGEPKPVEEIDSLCREALKVLDPRAEPQMVPSLVNMMETWGETEVAMLRKVLEPSPDEMVRRYGPLKTGDALHQTIAAIAVRDPLFALSSIERIRAFSTVHPNEELQAGLFEVELKALQAWSGFTCDATAPASVYPDLIQQEFAAISGHRDGEDYDVGRCAARLATLANTAVSLSVERQGLEVLEMVKQIAPVFAKRHEHALDYLRISLWRGMAVDAFKSKQLALGVTAYSRAAELSLRLELSAMAIDYAEFLGDCVDKSGTAPFVELNTALARIAAPLVKQCGRAGRATILNICQRALELIGKNVSPAAFEVLQFAKGFEFAGGLVNGIAHMRSISDEEQSLLAEIAQVEKEMSESASPAGDAGAPEPKADPYFWRELQAVAYTSTSEYEDGDALAERHANLRRSFDERLNQRLLNAPGELSASVLSASAVQAALDDKTVLVYFFLGWEGAETAMVHAIVLWKESRAWQRKGINVGGKGSMMLEDAGQSLLLHPVSTQIARTRQLVQRFAGPDPISDEAAALLATAAGELFQDPELLQTLLEQGKDHLCIVPHGPLHYYPFHLMDFHGAPLADKWKVSVLPNLDLLVAGGSEPSLRTHRDPTVAAIGLSYANDATNPFHKAPLKNAAPEVEAIAALFGVPPILDPDATEEALEREMRRARYIHLAVHGERNIEAAAFHCLYLAPGEKSDGMLCAHEVLRWDLRGIDLITLSACDSGLGRFDEGDNLRGLPASFLLAGAATVIGTLWEVGDEASRFFFTELYTRLKDPQSKLDAFAAAQAKTREKFPRYADWGGFYLAGDWQ